MLENLPKDLKTRAYVLKRTNYAEADRILNVITPVGKIAVMAKGVRKARSKMAGAIEMFTLVELNLHFGKSEMAVLTGAKMLRFYPEILKDFDKMELASEILKKISRASENIDSADFFMIVDSCLNAINDGANLDLVETWFLMRLAKAMGEQINLYYDKNGEKLAEDKKYIWNEMDKVLEVQENAEIDANAIKIMRMAWTVDFEVFSRIKNVEKFLPIVFEIAKTV